jgi:hypothetical protein
MPIDIVIDDRDSPPLSSFDEFSVSNNLKIHTEYLSFITNLSKLFFEFIFFSELFFHFQKSKIFRPSFCALWKILHKLSSDTGFLEK